MASVAKSFPALLYFSITMISTTSAELFTALSHVERLVNIEMELTDALDEYIDEQEERLNKLKSFADDVSEAIKHAKEDRYAYLGHPVNSFLMVKRFVNEWPQIERSILQEGDKEGVLNDKLENYRDFFPKQDDLEGAMAAIKRLQEVYNLKPFDFTGGKYGVRTVSGSLLNAMDAYKIGRAAFVSEDMKRTQQWMAESLRQMDHEPGNQKEMPNRFTVLDHLAWSSYQLGDVQGAINFTAAALEALPGHERSKTNLDNFLEIKNRLGELPKEMNEKERTYNYLAKGLTQKELKNFDWFEERRIYKKLCRGEFMPKPPQSPSRLKCFHKTGHPLCTIKRCPVEVVFTNPDIMILHGIMSESEINRVIEISTPLLNRATVHNPVTGHLEYAHYRISKNCWLSGRHDQLIEKINRRIAALTGLNLHTAEDFQVQNYGLAGQYDPHFDFSRDLENSSLGQLGTGNRIATVLLYMSDVEAGGATVFPYVGARVLPSKGDAVFWFNLLKSGDGDFRTRHAGCPILKGIKWVANKWIHEYGNEFRRPCSLSPYI